MYLVIETYSYGLSPNADWYDCSELSCPAIASAPGIDSKSLGVIDTYAKRNESFNNKPTWHGLSNGYICYWCSRHDSWNFINGPDYIADQSTVDCATVMYLKEGKWRVYNGISFMDSTPTVQCTHRLDMCTHAKWKYVFAGSNTTKTGTRSLYHKRKPPTQNYQDDYKMRPDPPG